MMSMQEYKIIHGSKEEVESQVNDLTDEGWSLYGSVQVIYYKNQPVFTQTLSKPKEIRGPWD